MNSTKMAPKVNPLPTCRAVISMYIYYISIWAAASHPSHPSQQVLLVSSPGPTSGQQGRSELRLHGEREAAQVGNEKGLVG